MDTTTPSATIVLVFSGRKPGMTFAAYKEHYETQHVPLVARLVLQDDLCPLSFTRQYTNRDDATLFPLGGVERFDYDCITRLVFRDTAHRDAVFTEFSKHAEEIQQDEERFLDRAKLSVVFIGEACASVRQD